jgi:hypothetical protein
MTGFLRFDLKSYYGKGKRIMKPFVSFLIVILYAFADSVIGSSVTIPSPPPLDELASLIILPDGECNAADFYLEAENAYRGTELIKSPEHRMTLPEHSGILKLMEKGLLCRQCEFPYSREITLPPYNQMIPMMALYRAAAHTWRLQGDEALKNKAYSRAAACYHKPLVLGFQLFNEPGITIIQDMISFTCMQEGAEGLGDLYIAIGDAEKAAICARFLANRVRYIDALPEFVSSILRGQNHPLSGLTENYKAVSLLYPAVDYQPIKVEILLVTAELLAFNRKNDDLVTCCRMVIDHAVNDPDERIRKMAQWALEWDIQKHVDLMKQDDIEPDENLLKLIDPDH